MEKNITIIIVIAVTIIAIAGVWFWMSNNPMPATTSDTNNTTNPDGTTTTNDGTNTNGQNSNQVKGTLYVSLADAVVDMKDVTAVNMTIDKVEAFNKVNGWITLSKASLTFNLLDLKAKHQTAVIASVKVPADTYKQFKIHVAKVMVTSSGTAKEAKLPAGDFTITTDVKVNPNTNSAVQFDVLADKSMHVTAKGEYVFTPVVVFSSKVNATVTIGADNMISASNGQTNADVKAGMDVDGKIKTDFMVDQNAKIDIIGGVIKVNTVILP